VSPFLNTYNRVPLTLVRGQGTRVQDDAGRWYLDAICGIAVMSLGHQHPQVTAAVHAQVDALMHVSNLYSVPVQERFAQALMDLFGGPVFLCNSGAEANEGALKLVRKHHFLKGESRPQILVAQMAFHGRTMGALALTAREKFSRGFGPLPGGVVALPDAELAQAVNAQTAAVFVEPIRGEGGCISFPHLPALREACDRHGALLVYDEIQCGLGRSGTLVQQPAPDIRTLAKALGGGLPLGAVLAGPHLAHVFEPGDHGSTFGGNPVACAAGLATLQEILEQDLTERCRVLGKKLRAGLEALGVCVSGAGLMQAAHLEQEAAPVVARMRDRGVLVCGAGPRAVRFLPAFTSTEAEIEEMVSALAASL
jgi:acetylornithine/succinyldiaminopimelate/putrescine aminotransferase